MVYGSGSCGKRIEGLHRVKPDLDRVSAVPEDAELGHSPLHFEVPGLQCN